MPDYQPLHRCEHFLVTRYVYCTVSVLMNHLYAYSQLWKTQLPRNSVLRCAEVCVRKEGRHFEQ